MFDPSRSSTSPVPSPGTPSAPGRRVRWRGARWLLLAVALQGCGGGFGSGGGPSAAADDLRVAFSYSGPGVERAEYRFGDTAAVSIVMGEGGSQRIPVEVEARLVLSLAPSGRDVRVTARFPSFSGTMASPLGGSTVVTEEQIQGPLIFSLTPRGDVVLQSLPDLDAPARQILSPASLAREIFPRFPPRPPSEAGETWTDTLTYQTRQGEATLAAERHLTYTFRGEATEAGRRVLRITSRGRTRYSFEGTRMGMETRQTLEGPVEGEYLWDPERRIPVSARTEKRLTGTMELPALGTPPVPLELTGTTRITLVEGGG